MYFIDLEFDVFWDLFIVMLLFIIFCLLECDICGWIVLWLLRWDGVKLLCGLLFICIGELLDVWEGDFLFCGECVGIFECVGFKFDGFKFLCNFFIFLVIIFLMDIVVDDCG